MIADKNNNSEYSPEEIHDMIYGIDELVELENESRDRVPAINLDNAATTPPLKQVVEEIEKELLLYGSVGRGKGQKSEHSSTIYTEGRNLVKNFLGIETKQDMEKYEVFYVNSTTEGMNKLASALIDSPDDLVLTTRMEHHANDLPWRERARTVYAEVDGNGRLIEDDFERLLYEYRGRIKYVTVTAASNVIGYVNDVHKIAAVAHKYGAQIIVDGAQIVAHRKFSMLGEIEDENIDFFVFSAHKMYSPFGGGAVVGLKKELDRRIPKFFGGGMVDAVNDDSVYYSWSPDRYEAGSPNYPGVVGMLRAIKFLKDEVGFDYIEKHEQKLLRKAIDDLRNIPAVILYGDTENISDRVGILVFNIKNIENGKVAEYLAGQAAIAVRHAKFCAHTYVNRLLGLESVSDSAEGCLTHEGMVRVSFGIYSDEKDVDALVRAVEKMLRGDNIMLRASDMAAPVRNLPNDRG